MSPLWVSNFQMLWSHKTAIARLGTWVRSDTYCCLFCAINVQHIMHCNCCRTIVAVLTLECNFYRQCSSACTYIWNMRQFSIPILTLFVGTLFACVVLRIVAFWHPLIENIKKLWSCKGVSICGIGWVKTPKSWCTVCVLIVAHDTSWKSFCRS